MAFLLIYITHPDEKTAKQLSNLLVQEKLAACANYFPITSAYWWQGAVAREGEWVSLVKTSERRWKDLVTFVEEHHPYEVPCIMRLNVSANAAYEKWIEESVRQG